MAARIGERQLLAFAMDTYAREVPDAPAFPGPVRLLLGKRRESVFPGPFLEYYEGHWQTIVEAFFSQLEGQRGR